MTTLTNNNDTFVATNGNDIVDALAGHDTVYLADGHDLAYGGAGNDSLYGGSGDDVLTGGSGGDHLSGYTGFDFVQYGLSPAGISLDLATGQASGGDAAGDTLSSIEGVFGSGYGDVVVASAANNHLVGNGGADYINALGGNDVVSGGAGNDTLEGRDGSDFIVGGNGADQLWGGTGIDTFDFNTGESGVGVGLRDQIVDFQDFIAGVGRDKIDLSNIDANASLSGTQDFQLVQGSFTNLGQLHVRQEGGNSIVEANITGSTAPDFQIQLDGLHTLTLDNFVL